MVSGLSVTFYFLLSFNFHYVFSVLLLTVFPIVLPKPAMTRSMHSSLGSAGTESFSENYQNE